MKRPKVEIIPLTGDGSPATLAALIAAVQAKGVSDLSKVRVLSESNLICTCQPGLDQYCYCDQVYYSDVRLEWEIPGQ